jgi:nicotinate phosphoribosyltransferase
MLGQLLRDGYSPILATDLYQLTMAQGYWKNEIADREAGFDMYFRRCPYNGAYAIMAGLEDLVGALQQFRFTSSDVAYLATLKDRTGQATFEDRFLRYLEDMRLTCDLSAVPEGTVVFPYESLVRVQGPIVQGQLLETLLLNTLNFQTLIATKAARICLAAKGEPVVEFGLRRAQGLDGGLSASRAAYVGGCSGTSNVLAGKLLGIPVYGTHAHSWVMAFDSEIEAFEAYARAKPDDSLFLVDTYGTIKGIENAIAVGRKLKDGGHKMVGLRLDSGDLAYFSIQARRMLDEAGFTDAMILASNELDEYVIRSLKNQGARINMWGVGTKLVTAYDEPALSGVYKLSALREAGTGEWKYKLKLSEQRIKISVPGLHQVYRYHDEDGRFAADAIMDWTEDPKEVEMIVDPNDATKSKRLSRYQKSEPLLMRVFDKGRLVTTLPSLPQVQQRTKDQLALLDDSHKRLEYPHIYPVGLSPRLHSIRENMIQEQRKLAQSNGW